MVVIHLHEQLRKILHWEGNDSNPRATTGVNSNQVYSFQYDVLIIIIIIIITTTIIIKSRLSLIVRVNVVLNRTVVVDSDLRFDNLCGSHLQSQSELYHVSRWYYILWLLI